jgi:CheY-like chemotaxis protein
MEEKPVQILVVDDDELVREVTLRWLASLGYRTIAAATGREALAALCQDGAVDLLITDVHMDDDMNGIDLAREARRMRPEIKVLFMSGAAGDALVPDGGDGSDVNLLVKPCSKAELAQKVRKILGAG